MTYSGTENIFRTLLTNWETETLKKTFYWEALYNVLGICFYTNWFIKHARKKIHACFDGRPCIGSLLQSKQCTLYSPYIYDRFIVYIYLLLSYCILINQIWISFPTVILVSYYPPPLIEKLVLTYSLFLRTDLCICVIV